MNMFVSYMDKYTMISRAKNFLLMYANKKCIIIIMNKKILVFINKTRDASWPPLSYCVTSSLLLYIVYWLNKSLKIHVMTSNRDCVWNNVSMLPTCWLRIFFLTKGLHNNNYHLNYLEVGVPIFKIKLIATCLCDTYYVFMDSILSCVRI